MSDDDGEKGCDQEVDDDANRHGLIGDARAPVVVGPQVQPLDPSTAVKGVVLTGRGFKGDSGSGSGDVRTELPPRDSA